MRVLYTCVSAFQGAGPLSDALLVRELCALRVLRSKRAALERQMSDFDTRLQERTAGAEACSFGTSESPSLPTPWGAKAADD